MIKPLLILGTCLLMSHTFFAQAGRLESEYKLDVHTEDVPALWDFVQSAYGRSQFNLEGLQLSGVVSTEVFIDKYFDLSDGSFADGEISLRHRKRFKDGQLLKQLIQLKTPYSDDKVIRNEIKFEVTDNKNIKDATQRHDLLKYLKSADADRLAYHLVPLKARLEALECSLKLKQTRKRIYIADQTGASIATITLDEVNLARFPFNHYAEMELELNEVRYTEADAAERKKMTALNEAIKMQLSNNFPRLKVDQRSKYRKMKLLVDNSLAASAYDNLAWLFFGLITLLAAFFFIKDQML